MGKRGRGMWSPSGAVSLLWQGDSAFGCVVVKDSVVVRGFQVAWCGEVWEWPFRMISLRSSSVKRRWRPTKVQGMVRWLALRRSQDSLTVSTFAASAGVCSVEGGVLVPSRGFAGCGGVGVVWRGLRRDMRGLLCGWGFESGDTRAVP